MGWLGMLFVRIHPEVLSHLKFCRHPVEGRDPFLLWNLWEEWFPACAGMTAYVYIAKPCLTLYNPPIPDIVMSNNTGPEYGSEGEESYVRTADAQGYCRLVG